jgi:endoglucanase
MDQNNIPNCNWSLRQQTSDVDQKSEKSAIFAGDKSLITAAALDAATLTSSGSIIKSYLTKNARSWADSVTKGKSGSCSFKPVTAKQTEGKISGKLVAGCTYTSSNEKIASVSGSDIVINDYGYVIMTGNDGSQSVVTITQVAGQTIANLEDLTCNFSGTCKSASKTGRTIDFDGDGTNDYILTMEDKTNEGSAFKLSSLDPSVVTVSKTTCTNSGCSNTQKNKQVWMLHFKSFGTTKVVASAAAVTGFRAMQDTFEITYKKGDHRISDKFKNQVVAVNFESATGLPDATITGKAPITYTFNGKETSAYMIKFGEGFATSAYPAIIAVTANAPETENYAASSRTVTFIIGGDSTLAMNKDEYYSYINGTTDAIKPVRKVQNSLQASMNGTMLQFTTKNTGLVKVDIYDALGASVKQMSDVYGKGSHAIDLKGLPNGSYTLVIRQGSHKASVRWTNK